MGLDTKITKNQEGSIDALSVAAAAALKAGEALVSSAELIATALSTAASAATVAGAATIAHVTEQARATEPPKNNLHKAGEARVQEHAIGKMVEEVLQERQLPGRSEQSRQPAQEPSKGLQGDSIAQTIIRKSNLLNNFDRDSNTGAPERIYKRTDKPENATIRTAEPATPLQPPLDESKANSVAKVNARESSAKSPQTQTESRQQEVVTCKQTEVANSRQTQAAISRTQETTNTRSPEPLTAKTPETTVTKRPGATHKEPAEPPKQPELVAAAQLQSAEKITEGKAVNTSCDPKSVQPDRQKASEAPPDETQKVVLRSFSPLLLEACAKKTKLRKEESCQNQDDTKVEQKQVLNAIAQQTIRTGQAAPQFPPIRKEGDPLNTHKEKKDCVVDKTDSTVAANPNSRDNGLTCRTDKPTQQDRTERVEPYQGPTCVANVRERPVTPYSVVAGLNSITAQAASESTKQTGGLTANPPKQGDNIDNNGKGDPCLSKTNVLADPKAGCTNIIAGDSKLEGSTGKTQPRTITDLDGTMIPMRPRGTGDSQGTIPPSHRCHGQRSEREETPPVCPRPGVNTTTGQPVEGQPPQKGTGSINAPGNDGKCTINQGDLKRTAQTDQPGCDSRLSNPPAGNITSNLPEPNCTRRHPSQPGLPGSDLPASNEKPRLPESCHHNGQTGRIEQPTSNQTNTHLNQGLERASNFTGSYAGTERLAGGETALRQNAALIPERVAVNVKGNETVERAAVNNASSDKVSSPDLTGSRLVQLQNTNRSERISERASSDPFKVGFDNSRYLNQISERTAETKSPPSPPQERLALLSEAARIAPIVDQYFSRFPEWKNQSKEQVIAELVRQLRDNGIIGGTTGLSEGRAVDIVRLLVQQRDGGIRNGFSNVQQLQQIQTGQNSNSINEIVQLQNKQAALPQLLNPYQSSQSSFTWTVDQNGKLQVARQPNTNTSGNQTRSSSFDQYGLRPEGAAHQATNKADAKDLYNAEKVPPAKTTIDSSALAPNNPKYEEQSRHHQHHQSQAPGQKHQPVRGEGVDNITDKRFPARKETEEIPPEWQAVQVEPVNSVHQPWIGIIGIPGLSGSGRPDDGHGDKTSSSSGKALPVETRCPDRRLRYIVQQGDTLESIACKKLADARFAGLILIINRSVIGFRNQGLIRIPDLQIGQVLWLPSQLELEIHRKHFFPKGKSPIPSPNIKLIVEPADLCLPEVEPSDAKTLQSGARLEDVEPFQPPPMLVLFDGELPVTGSKPGDQSISPIQDKQEAIESPISSPLSLTLLRLRHSGNRSPIPLDLTISQRTVDALRRCWKVEAGDSLCTIALDDRLMSDRSMWRLIARVNGLPEYVEANGEPAVRLTSGQEIFLPNAQEIAQFRLLNQLSHAAHPEFQAILDQAVLPSTTRPTVKASGQPEIEARMLVSKLSDLCRIVVAAPGDRCETFITRLQAAIDGRWTTIAAYESRIGKTVRFIYNFDGSRKSFHMDLPAAVVKGMADEDFKRNWQEYLDSFMLQDKRSNGPSAS
jgi:hypothetical protein